MFFMNSLMMVNFFHSTQYCSQFKLVIGSFQAIVYALNKNCSLTESLYEILSLDFIYILI